MKLNRLKEVLAEKQLKNKDLARIMNISPQRVSGWATGNAQPSIENLYRIASALHVEASELLVKSNPFI